MHKQDFKQTWAENTPEERRAALDSLDMTNVTDEDKWAEHDALAEMVAMDEETAKVEENAS